MGKFIGFLIGLGASIGALACTVAFGVAAVKWAGAFIEMYGLVTVTWASVVGFIGFAFVAWLAFVLSSD
jgi:hypothetical protein